MTNSKDKTNSGFSDIAAHLLPQSLQGRLKPYALLMRLERPTGWWLLYLPCLMGLTLAAGTNIFSYLHYVFLFLVGSIVMRGAGCVVNDLWDRELDAKVERTKNRPLASGEISVRQALIFLAVLLFIGLMVLLTLPRPAIWVALCFVPLIVVYPLMKRVTWWPQAFLGITFNAGALIGWVSVTHSLDYSAWLLYVACFFWTMGYDTIYACQDKEDDVFAGIKSAALKLGSRIRQGVYAFYAVMTLVIAALFVFKEGALGAILIFLMSLTYVCWMLKNWDHNDQESSLATFKRNRWLGVLIAVMFCLMP